MRLFKSSEYAIRCMVHMALSSQELCSVKHLSESLDIPYKFLGRLMSRLGEAGFVTAVRGKSGGYHIARPLNKIRLVDIIDVVEGLENYERCILGFESCDCDNPCPLHEAWSGYKEGILEMLQTQTLASMVASGATRIGVCVRP